MQNTAVKELNFYQHKITEIAQFTVTPHRALTTTHSQFVCVTLLLSSTFAFLENILIQKLP